MKSVLVLNLTIFTLVFSDAATANGQLIQDDPIMRESLTRQGVPAPPFEGVAQLQQEEQELVSVREVQKLEKQVQALQRQVDRLKMERRQMQQSDEEGKSKTEKKKVTRVELKNGLRDAQEGGSIGKYSIMKGTTTARAFVKAEVPEERQIPALQVCATMADVNRMNKEDFAFLGFEPQVAEKIINSRELLGAFKSSKQITAVEGVEPEVYDVVRQSIIAIEPQRLSE